METTKELLKDLLLTLKETKGFVLEQAPDLAQQLLAFEAWSSATGLWAGIAMLVLSICFFSLLIVSFIRFWEEVGIASLIIGICLLVGGAIATPVNYYKLNKIKIAPKVFVMDYLAKRLK